MLIEVQRKWFSPKSTIGEMSVDGVFECFTLEDVIRPGGLKVWGETAIPEGGYDVAINMSSRFKRLMPQLLNVPGFEGIRIHAGNTDVDTHGCILVGDEHGADFIGHSKIAYDRLFKKMQSAVKPIRLVIR